MIWTVFLYSIPAGGAGSFQVVADDANKAAKAAIKKANLSPLEYELIAVMRGIAQFEPVDEKQFTLFPGF